MGDFPTGAKIKLIANVQFIEPDEKQKTMKPQMNADERRQGAAVMTKFVTNGVIQPSL